MRKIRLNQRFDNLTPRRYALVDDEDYEWLNQWKWFLNGDGYAARTDNLNHIQIRMHRLINQTPEGFDTDHKNRHRLDNRRSNLRTATHSQNMRNIGLFKHNTSGHAGVSWYKQQNSWRAYIQVNSKYIRLGYFKNLSEAIRARKEAEIGNRWNH